MSGVIEFVGEALTGAHISPASQVMVLCEACWTWWPEDAFCGGQVCAACCLEQAHAHPGGRR